MEDLAIQFYPPLICTHVMAEFLYGQATVGVSSAARLEARKFLDSFELLAPGRSTAAIYAELRASLKARGVILPDPDYWIAAHTLEEAIPLVTTDTHFRKVDGIQLHLVKTNRPLRRE